MKRLVGLVILVVILAGFLLADIVDTSTSIADSSLPNNNEPTSVATVEDGSDSYASATITITMTPVSLPDG